MCSQCNQRAIEHPRLGICHTCYSKNYWRSHNKLEPNGNICACGCGQPCYYGNDKFLPKHRTLCRCGCGQRLRTRRAIYRPGHGQKGRKCTEESRLRMSIARRGKPKSDAHKVAIARGLRRTDMPNNRRHQLIRKWAVYRQWRSAVFDRDHYTCQTCGARNGNGKRVDLEADHIIPFAVRPDLILSVANGRTLCITCHRKTKTWGTKATKWRGFKQRAVLQLPLEMVIQ